MSQPKMIPGGHSGKYGLSCCPFCGPRETLTCKECHGNDSDSMPWTELFKVGREYKDGRDYREGEEMSAGVKR